MTVAYLYMICFSLLCIDGLYSNSCACLYKRFNCIFHCIGCCVIRIVYLPACKVISVKIWCCRKFKTCSFKCLNSCICQLCGNAVYVRIINWHGVFLPVSSKSNVSGNRRVKIILCIAVIPAKEGVVRSCGWFRLYSGIAGYHSLGINTAAVVTIKCNIAVEFCFENIIMPVFAAVTVRTEAYGIGTFCCNLIIIIAAIRIPCAVAALDFELCICSKLCCQPVFLGIVRVLNRL